MSFSGIPPKLCGCIGCSDAAALVVNHPDHGKRTVCPTHANDYPVMREIADDGGEGL